MVDLVVQFYQLVQPLLSRILDLLSNFIRYRASALLTDPATVLARLILLVGSKQFLPHVNMVIVH